MTNILVTHLDSNGKQIGTPFVANLANYMKANKSNNKFDWDKAITAFYKMECYTTFGMPYGDIRMELAESK